MFSLRAGLTLMLGGIVLLGGVLPGCTLITDVDRQRIPVPPDPIFPEMEAGTGEASSPHPPMDSGGAGGGLDAAPDAEVAVDAGDAGADPEPDASGDGG